MAVAQRDPVPGRGILMEDILDAVRSEPAVAWFLAQALWIAQPALEAFWPREKVEAIAELLESKMEPAPEDESLRGRGESGKRM